MKKIELLAPAGNFDCLKAAINNGANAVYLGGKNFSARAFANNFDENEIIDAVKYAHLHNAKVYVTLNTLLNENEINNAIKMVDFYYTNNVDALLIQDLGLYYYIKNKYPDFELHCSTQMHIHNLQGVINAKKMGFKRVVVARESSLDFIKEACKQNIEIETFVHGAICVSYSGQCLMSSVIKNRSANKGMCAQCCRLKYDLLNSDNNKIKTDTDYILSPKDMCLINDIPKLIKAGVSSFKIEGRLKSAAYVGYVTRIYRKAIDSYYKGKEYSISKAELDDLKVLFNRNFTNDYLNNISNLFGQKTPNHLGIEIGDAFKYENGFTYIKLNNNLNQFDGIRINDYGCIVNMLYKNNLLISSANANEIVAIKTDKKYIGKVYKTQDYLLEKSVLEIKEQKLPLDLTINAYQNKNIEINLKYNDVSFKYVSNYTCSKAINQPLDYNSFKNQFSKLGNTIYFLNSLDLNTDGIFLPIKDLNEIRRKSIESFNEYRLSLFKREVIESNIEFKKAKYDEINNILLTDDIAKNNEDIYEMNYVINKNSFYTDDKNAVISEIGGLFNEYTKKIAYYTLNCCNSYAYEFLKRVGFDAIIMSTELNLDEIKKVKEAYKLRNNICIKPYILKEGRRVLMYLKSNPFEKYIKDNKNYYIEDQNNRYLINYNHGITEIIENGTNNNINKQLFIILN